MAEDQTTDQKMLDAVLKALASPKSYSLDGESISGYTPDELAKLISMARQLKGEQSPVPQSGRSPFKVSVQSANSTYSE